MNISDLETLVVVTRHGSFDGAARELGVDPSSVSRTVAGLETELGARLLQRNTRRLALTEAGAAFVERLAPALEELAQARAAALDATGELRGTLRISVSNAFGIRRLSPLLPKFCEDYPELQLEVLMAESPVDLIADRVDVAIRLGKLRDSGLIAVPLLAVRYRVVASPAWLRRQENPPTRPVDLQATKCLCFALFGFRDQWQFSKAKGGESVKVAVRPRLVGTNALLLRDAALEGMGPALLADWMIGEDVGAGLLVDLFPDYVVSTAGAPSAAWAVYPSRNHVPAKVKVFVDFLRISLSARGSQPE